MRRFGPFELVARLGRGGSAEVWRALHHGAHGFCRTVALKRLLPERLCDDKLRASLLAEARLAAQLTHPNVAQVLDVVEAGGEHAIVMELVDGCDLRTLVRALAPLGPPSPGLAAYVAHEVGRALGAAHAMRPPILHRDVSATNVLVSRTGAVKLADFGIGKALAEASSDGTASLKGNLGYMAPEQLARAPVSPASDVYAAGVLLWELLTGRRLFAAAFELAASAEVRLRPIAPPSSLNGAVPPALDAICARATALVAAERWPDGAAFAHALEPHVHALGFGPTQLAALMRDFAPPAIDDEPSRHTVTVAGATATLVDPPRQVGSSASASPSAAPSRPQARRRTSAIAAIAVLAAATAGAWFAWPSAVREIAPPARRVSAASPGAVPLAATLPPPLPPRPSSSSAASSARAIDHNHDAHRAKPAARSDFVDGKLLNPFNR